MSTADKVHQVSIIPRGMAGGYTMSLPSEDKSYRTRREMEENIVTLLGGRVAEALVLDDISTGASNDIERATAIARAMVTRYGFSEKLGPVVYGTDQGEVFLGRDLSQGRNYSDEVAAEIDSEIRKLVEGGYRKAESTLMEHMDQLILIAETLLRCEKIDVDDFDSLMKTGATVAANKAAEAEAAKLREAELAAAEEQQSSEKAEGDTTEAE